jgi:exonuclease VII small subunit
MPRKNAINAGLTLSRYDLGREIDYGVPEVEAFELKWNSDVIPREPLKLGGPGLTVSPPRKGQEMDESLLMNEVEDILQEAKKTVLQMPKPRDPNWQTMQAKAASGAGGKHIDKKRAEKQGNVKHKNKFNYKQDNWSSDFERRMKNEDQFELVKKLQWPEVVNKVNSAMKAMGWKGQRKDDGSFMFSTRGQLPEESDEWYIVIIDNRGNNMFTYALGTVEEGDPHIGEQETLPNTEASVSELMDAVREGFGLGESQGVAEGYDSEELANEVYAEFERMYPNLARRANERTVHAAIMDVLNYGGDSDPAALAQDVARAVKRNMQGVSEGENFRDKKSLEQRLYNYEAAVNRAREATRVIKNADMHMEIISEILELAKKTGIEETEFKDQIDDIYEAVSNLQSEVYKLEEPFTDAVRLVQNTLDELEIDEWERNRSKDNE